MAKKQEERIFIREAAKLINRQMDTLRRWDSKEILPKNLRSKREESKREWRYWTPKQIEGIKKWMKKTDRRPGKGLKHWKPSEDEVDGLLEKLRKPRQDQDSTQ